MKTAQIFGTVFCLIFVADTITAQQRLGQQNSAQSIPGCLLEDRFFEDEVWRRWENGPACDATMKGKPLKVHFVCSNRI